MRPRRSDEERGLRYLANAAKPLTPFKNPTTQYFILGDGVRMPMAKKLRLVSVQPKKPAITIDPEYEPQFVYTGKKTRGRLRAYPKDCFRLAYMKRRAGITKAALKKRAPNWPPSNTRRLTFIGKKAEGYKPKKSDFLDTAFIVVLSCRAHTSTAAFVSKLRRVKPSATKLFAASLPCHSPGLKGKMLIKDGWQIQCPRGTVGYEQSDSAREAVKRGARISRGTFARKRSAKKLRTTRTCSRRTKN